VTGRLLPGRMAHSIGAATREPGGDSMKKLLIILILAAIGIAVAKKVREA